MVTNANSFKTVFVKRIIVPEVQTQYTGKIVLQDITPPNILADVYLDGIETRTYSVIKTYKDRPPGILNTFLDYVSPIPDQVERREEVPHIIDGLEKQHYKLEFATLVDINGRNNKFKMKLLNKALSNGTPMDMNTLDALYDPSIEKIMKQMKDKPLF